MYCEKCGKKIEGDSGFCEFCGVKRLHEQARSPKILKNNKLIHFFKKIFIRTDINLADKWWHRLLKVIFSIITFIVFILSFIIASSSINPTKYNSAIITLRDFTKSSSENIDNTIPEFIKIDGSTGCLDLTTNHVDYLSSYDLNLDGICNANIQKNIDKVAKLVLAENVAYRNYTSDEIKGLLQHILDTDTEHRYCFIPISVKCSSDKIVNYRHNALFYLEALGIAIIVFFVWTIIIISIYYKGIVYIIYGSNKVKPRI